jgi:uncharacterized protein DUF2442
MSISDDSTKIVSLTFTSKLITVHLSNGQVVSNPLEWYPRLYKASAAQRKDFEISGGGYAVHWEELDEDLSAEGLARGVPSFEYRKPIPRVPRRKVAARRLKRSA